METTWSSTRLSVIAAVTGLLLTACSSPPPAPGVPSAAPTHSAPAEEASRTTGWTPGGSMSPVGLAPRNPALESWKRSAAQRIHQVNQKKLFEGRPHHLLQAVIVVEATVDRNGNVVASKVTRSPKIKKLDDMALASLKAASPLPAPPQSLLVRGNLVFSETWLVQNDGTFQVRTLALPQE